MDAIDEAAYAQRLAKLQGAKWKQILDVQAPYRRIITRYCPGKVLEIGSGIGRNLRNLRGNAVGIDTNGEAVQMCRDLGFRAYTPMGFCGSPDDVPGSYDALLLAHLLEHVTFDEGNELIVSHLKYLRPGAHVMVICPQERGYASDPTHIRWIDFSGLEAHRRAVGLKLVNQTSFPFPRAFGKAFIYNEFIQVWEFEGSNSLNR